MSELVNLNDLQEQLDVIKTNLAQAKKFYETYAYKLNELEKAGIFRDIPSEQWQNRGNGEDKYLYLLFRKGPNGEYMGPGGRRKLYVGCKVDSIQTARDKVARTNEHRELKQRMSEISQWVERQLFYVKRCSINEFNIAFLGTF